MTDKEAINSVKLFRHGGLVEHPVLVEALDSVIKQVEETQIAKEDVRVIEIKISDLYVENSRLREALKFYADKENHLWIDEENTTVTIDNGNLARQALESAPK